MDNSPENSGEPKPRLNKEYEDPHYHDEEEVAPAEEGEQRSHRPAWTQKRKTNRRPPPPRRYYED